jgi:polysaccharide export outer membrane protein
MKRFFCLMMLGLLLSAGPACAEPAAKVAAAKPADAAYVVGAGDVLVISVWRDEALTRTVVVTPDGRISFPLVGELPAAGLTIKQLGNDLKRRLERYVPDAELNIAVQQANSQAVYVLGEVLRPGRYPMNGPTTTLQALAMAGGLSPYARENSIKIFNPGEAKPLKFKYRRVVAGKQIDAPVASGAVIVVP